MASFSVVCSTGDGLDHEVLDSDITATVTDESRRRLATLSGIQILPERDLRQRVGKRCQDCVNTRLAMNPEPVPRGRNPAAAVFAEPGSGPCQGVAS